MKTKNNMDKIAVKVINKSNNPMPSYATPNAVCVDLRANLEEDVVIQPGEIKLIPTGLFMEIPVGYEGQVRSRSGLALKNKIRVFQAPGTIDPDYRGELGVILENANQIYPSFTIHNGDRIAQLKIAKYEQVEFIEVKELNNDTERADGGFGHTGVE